MNFDREEDKLREEFFRNYRGRYSSYWIERWGLIPELPTSFDNANSIYELLAWLQRAFKQLLDDFVALESELEDFKNAFTELLENLVPLLIRRYHNSEEFRKLFITMLKDILSGEERTWFKDFLKKLLENDMREWFKDYLKTILNDPELKEFFKKYLKELLNDPSMKEWFKDYLKTILSDPSMKEWFKDYLKTILSDPELKEWFKKYFKDLLTDPTFLDKLRDILGIKELENKVNKINTDITDIKNMLNTLKFMSSGQPPYNTIIADYQNNDVISLDSNPNFPSNQGVGLNVANIQYETGDVVNRTTWLQINLGELRFKNIKQGDILGRVSIAKLIEAGLQPSMITGIELYNRLVAGITVDQRPVELVLSKDGNTVKISYVGGFMQAASETISGIPRTQNVSPWVQITETPK